MVFFVFFFVKLSIIKCMKFRFVLVYFVVNERNAKPSFLCPSV